MEVSFVIGTDEDLLEEHLVQFPLAQVIGGTVGGVAVAGEIQRSLQEL
ncbi:hypothetical protein [Corynebacterium variabile]